MKTIKCDSNKIDPKDQVLIDQVIAGIDNLLTEINLKQKGLEKNECLEGFNDFQEDLRQLDRPTYAQEGRVF